MTCVQVVLLNTDGEILAVSRKDNHSDFGLIGGKVDKEDFGDFMKAAIRETYEETGLVIRDLNLIFAAHMYGSMQYTYIAQYNSEAKIHTDEPHIVKWTSFDEICNGSFGAYNKMVMDSLIDANYKIKIYA